MVLLKHFRRFVNMATEVKKLKELEYDELITLGVIEKDEDLSTIFKEEINLSFNVLRTLAKENKLSDNTKSLMRTLFDKVILTKTDLINKYTNLAQSIGKTIKVLDDIPVIIEEVQINKTTKKEKVLPRRYGKALIQKDIQKQGGKPTNAQITALALNDLKNVYVNLNARLIKDMLTDKNTLTDEDYREIRSTITLVKNKLKMILKKK